MDPGRLVPTALLRLVPEPEHAGGEDAPAKTAAVSTLQRTITTLAPRPPPRVAPRPPPRVAFEEVATRASPAMRRAARSVSPAVARVVTYTAVQTLASVSPAMVRAARAPLSPAAKGGGRVALAPLSAKSGGNLDRWSQLALEQLRHVDL